VTNRSGLPFGLENTKCDPDLGDRCSAVGPEGVKFATQWGSSALQEQMPKWACPNQVELQPGATFTCGMGFIIPVRLACRDTSICTVRFV